jgi:hypothetical protein
MRPSSYFPKVTSTQEIIDNLAYCMNTMCEKEKASSEGIGFLAYMNDWKMQNFSVDYCYQFMMMLQGRIPVRVRMFLVGPLVAICIFAAPFDFFGSLTMFLYSDCQST